MVKTVVLVSHIYSLTHIRVLTRASTDITEFLEDDIKGPAQFICKSGQGCHFTEPAMNELIDSIFADPYITLDCKSGECLHYSQVPGYIVGDAPNAWFIY